MDDLSDLQARVAAAQEKLRLNADDQRKYGLRLNDVVTIVEGSLARQQDEMKRLQDAAVSLRLERDATKIAEGQAKSLYEAALVRLNLLQTQNEQLRTMVMTLLNVIEGRESASALQSVLQRLETTVHEIAAAPAVAEAAEAAIEDVAEIATEEPAAEPEAAEEPMAEAVADEIVEEMAEPAEDVAEADEIESAEAVEAADEAAADEDEMTADLDAAKPEAEVLAAEPAIEEMPTEEAAAEEAVAEEVGAEDEAAEVEITATAAEPLQMAAEEAVSEEAAEEEIGMEEVTGEEIAGEDVAGEEIVAEETAGEESVEATAGDTVEDLDEALSEDMPEDLGDMSMNGHRDIVTDADALVADEMAGEDGSADDAMEITAPAPAAAKVAALPEPDETLVSALLDAEKALIEAGASGVANINSPVAEIIRRISLRTREFSEASGS